MIEVKEPFWVPGIAGGPYARGEEVDLGEDLEEQLCPLGVASEKAQVAEE